jgi:hypothetical protein
MRTMASIGYVGLDTMGGAMVANLLKARFDVTGEAGVSFSGGRGKRQPTRSTPT